MEKEVLGLWLVTWDFIPRAVVVWHAKIWILKILLGIQYGEQIGFGEGERERMRILSAFMTIFLSRVLNRERKSYDLNFGKENRGGND